MGKKMQETWSYKLQAPKFNKNEKDKMLTATQEMINELPKLSERVSRINMRSNWIYMYELIEQTIQDNVIYTKALIDGKYLEFPYARITLYDISGESCTADFQRYNNQWMAVHRGTLAECIKSIEADDGWF